MIPITAKSRNLTVYAIYKDGSQEDLTAGAFSFTGFNAFRRKFASENDIDFLHIIANEGKFDVRWKIWRPTKNGTFSKRPYLPVAEAVKALFNGEFVELKVLEPTF